MFNSTVLEVAIGLSFCFAAVSLIASAINEALASLLKLRAGSLLQGVKALLNDQQFAGMARELYNHALVNPRDAGGAQSERDLKNRPSYIEPRSFALAMIDVIQRTPGDFTQLGQDIDAIPDAQLRRLMQGMYQRAAGRIETLQAELEQWFNHGMDRVSGAYKRRSQLISFVLALLIAALLNIDAFHLFRVLWNHPALVASLPVSSGMQTGQVLQALGEMPIGWGAAPLDVVALLTMVCGWLVTASSALFGAPFWFDLLQRLVQLRGTGRKAEAPAART